MPDRSCWTRREFFSGSLAAAGVSLLTGCGSRRAATPPPAPPLTNPATGSLRDHAARAKLLFGFAVNTRSLHENEAYRRIVREQCSILVAENAMKWHALRPSPREYFFDESDALLSFCEEHRIKLRGHNLCWHESLPSWFEATVNASNARQILIDHIRTVAGRYSGRLHSWDVVNEAVEVRDGRPDGLRNSPWLRLAGPDYIETAFRTAREADPTALLTYNDYGIESETREAADKRLAVLLLLRRLKQRNVPLDAVGIQSHVRAGSQYGAGLRQFIESCQGMGLEVFLSEMDVNDRELPENTGARDAGVAKIYRGYLETALASPNVTAMLTWGVDDGQTWLNSGTQARQDHQPQRPLLFDNHFRPKAALAAVRDVFDGRNAGRQGGKAPSRADRSVTHLPRL